MMRVIGTSKPKKKVIKAFVIMLFLLITIFSVPVQAQNSPPTVTKGAVTPRTGRPNIEYMFTVTYTDADNDTPSYVKVFIDQVDYQMEEVDPTDINYTNGKEYFFKKVLGEGSYTIYYSVDDGNGNVVNSKSFTLSVTWDVGHYDIIHFLEEKIFPGLMIVLIILFAVMFILCLVSIFMVIQLRRIAEGMEGLKGEEEHSKETTESEPQTQ